eukprot:TRINITY_DN333_c0_g1_i1.p1 TRINITY_DN333_c0_g1~~TRINITY_DN333_c0_g1_i1.p1  ORF type:complete len:135 (-),score=21.59 TRINITY_DN333_c0_g1_i1:279-683(-)
MALEWAALSLMVGAEAVLVLLLTLPGVDKLRKGLIAVGRSMLQPLLAVVPFSLFLLLDIYWKFEHLPHDCKHGHCAAGEQDRHIKSLYKSQRNLVLVIGSLLLYWVLYRVIQMLVEQEKLTTQHNKLKEAQKTD